MAPFPLFKIGLTVLKQLSKPLANFAIRKAKHSHFLRTYVFIPPAQFFHWWEVRIKMNAMGLGRSGENIPKLNEDKAIEIGANLFGEFVVVVFGLIIPITVERIKANYDKKQKEAEELAAQVALLTRITDQEFEMAQLQVQLSTLTRIVHAQRSANQVAQVAQVVTTTSNTSNTSKTIDNNPTNTTVPLNNSTFVKSVNYAASKVRPSPNMT